MDTEEESCIGRKICRVIRAIFIRVMFATHALITIWKLAEIKNDMRYLLLSLLILLEFIELILTLKVKKTGEWKWCCPILFLHVAIEVPAIWFMEIHRLEVAKSGGRLTTMQPNNIAEFGGKSTIMTSDAITFMTATNGYSGIEMISNQDNSTTYSSSMPAKDDDGLVDDMQDVVVGAVQGLADNVGKMLPVNLLNVNTDLWVTMLEQTMLYFLILGRWFLPRGDLSHDQLSQLLFVYIGMASDIMELFYLFGEKAVVQDDYMGYVILGVWSFSLCQFSFVLTSTNARYKREVTHDINTRRPSKAPSLALEEDSESSSNSGLTCTETEVWALLLSMAVQDIPFLCVRLYVGLALKVFTYNLLFFTMKNILVILLQTYRLIVVIAGRNNGEEEE